MKLSPLVLRRSWPRSGPRLLSTRFASCTRTKVTSTQGGETSRVQTFLLFGPMLCPRYVPFLRTASKCCTPPFSYLRPATRECVVSQAEGCFSNAPTVCARPRDQYFSQRAEVPTIALQQADCLTIEVRPPSCGRVFGSADKTFSRPRRCPVSAVCYSGPSRSKTASWEADRWCARSCRADQW